MRTVIREHVANIRPALSRFVVRTVLGLGTYKNPIIACKTTRNELHSTVPYTILKRLIPIVAGVC